MVPRKVLLSAKTSPPRSFPKPHWPEKGPFVSENLPPISIFPLPNGFGGEEKFTLGGEKFIWGEENIILGEENLILGAENLILGEEK